MYSSAIKEYGKSNNIEGLISPVISYNCVDHMPQAWSFWDFEGNSFCSADTVCMLLACMTIARNK